MPTRASRHTARGRAKRKSPSILVPRIQRGWIAGLCLLAAAIVTLLGLLGSTQGVLTGLWLDALRRAIGWGVYVAPLGLAMLGVWVIAVAGDRRIRLSWQRASGVMLLLLVGLALAHQFATQPLEDALAGRGGGFAGYWLSRALARGLGWSGGTVALLVGFAIGLTLALDVSLAEVLAGARSISQSLIAPWRQWLATKRAGSTGRTREAGVSSLSPLPTPEGETRDRRDPVLAERPSRLGQSPSDQPVVPTSPPGPALWELPRIEDVLDERAETQMSLADIREKARTIEDTLESLGVPVTVVEVNPGPVVTQFGLEPGYVERRDREGNLVRAKVKVSRISALANDLALALAAAPIRIEAPVPGKGIVGLEIPNPQPAVVGLRSVMDSEEFAASDSPLTVALGRDVSGEAVADDLASLPHLLIAGATGSGKSVCINALVACLLFRNSPDDLKLLMIDPKRVELSSFNGIPHLLAPVVVEVERVVGVLEWVTREMDRRYRAFAQVGARNLEAFNQGAATRAAETLPYIVVFVDELADLMMVSPEEVERSICRIAQLARATGIHLVIATQRPSVDVLTGLIKANFPARLSFAVSSQIDSRVILDTPGAEKLLGRGDSLYMAPDSPKLLRVQGCFVSDAELTRLVGFWKAQLARRVAAHLDQATASPLRLSPLVQQPLWTEMAAREREYIGEDPLLAQATALVTDEKRASVSFLQRRLRIGYSRAARLVDLLEAKGIIGPATGTSKARQVLEDSEDVSHSHCPSGDQSIGGAE